MNFHFFQLQIDLSTYSFVWILSYIKYIAKLKNLISTKYSINIHCSHRESSSHTCFVKHIGIFYHNYIKWRKKNCEIPLDWYILFVDNNINYRFQVALLEYDLLESLD